MSKIQIKESDRSIVMIRRMYTFLQEQNMSPETRDYFDMGFKAIGPWWRITGQVIGTGLTSEEEEWLLPDIIGHYDGFENSRDLGSFRQKRQKYFETFLTKVPGEGLMLDVTLEDPMQKMSARNLPSKPLDYIRWKHAIGHPQVGASFGEAESSPGLVQFYVDDRKASILAAKELNSIEDKALGIYSDAIRDFDKLEMILALMGQDVDKMADDEKILSLKDSATKDENLSAAANLTRLQKFIRVAEDKDLQSSYEVRELLRVGLLEQHGHRIVLSDDGKEIGATQKEAALWVADKRNSKIVNILKVNYKELAKKNIGAQETLAETAPVPAVKGAAKKEIIPSSDGTGEAIQIEKADNVEKPTYD